MHASAAAVRGPRVARAQTCRGIAARRPRRLTVAAAGGQIDDWAGRQFTLLSTSEGSTAHLAELLAGGRTAGDAYCLKGDAGAGKSAFCRAFVRAAARNPGLDVQPPPASLMPAFYDDGVGGPPLLHYNLAGMHQPGPQECAELTAAFPTAVSLIEWAEQLRQWGAAPEQRLALYFRRLPQNPGADARLISVVPHTGAWEARVALLHAALSVDGPAAGLVVLSDKMALEMLAGLPESELALAAAA